MMRRWVLSVVLAGAIAGVAGCERRTQTIRVDQAARGQTLGLTAGAKLTLTLPSNITTGYSWEVVEIDRSVLEQTAHAYVPPEGDRVGAGGVETWEFAARKAGTTPLRLEYRRSWEARSVEPADRFQITVNVRMEQDQ